MTPRQCMLDYAREGGLPEPDFDRLLGRGLYGSAYGTSDPEVVLKLTRDDDEGLLMAAQAKYNYPGIVRCHGAIRFPRGEWAIWKEALYEVGYPAWMRVFGEELIMRENHDPGTDWLELTRMIEDRDPDLGKHPTEALYDLAEMWPPLSAICETCVYLYDTFGLVPGDMHMNNFGCLENVDQMILFDAQMGAFAEKIDYESCDTFDDDDEELDNPRQVPLSEYGRLRKEHYGTGHVTRQDRPMAAVPYEEGTVLVDDQMRGPYGTEYAQLTTVRIDELVTPELAYGKGDELHPAKRAHAEQYAEWMKQGHEPPPIDVLEMEDGSLRVMEGHRRVVASRMLGRDTINAWVHPTMQHPEGLDMKVSATLEHAPPKGARSRNPRQAQGALTQMRPGTERVSRATVLNEMVRQDRGSIGRYDQVPAAKIRRRWDRPTTLPPGDYLRMWVPVSLLDYQLWEDSIIDRRRRAQEYALLGEEFPPILIRYGDRRASRGPATFMVANGNRRVLAAVLRGDKYIQAFVPASHWGNWHNRTGAAYQTMMGLV